MIVPEKHYHRTGVISGRDKRLTGKCPSCKLPEVDFYRKDGGTMRACVNLQCPLGHSVEKLSPWVLGNTLTKQPKDDVEIETEDL